jgi:Zn-dependent protease
VTMTHLPGAAPTDGFPGAGSPQGSGNRKGGLRIAGVTIRLTVGGYLLAILAAAAGALTLPAAAPGLSVGAYLAATAGLVALVLASVAGHELAHAIVARRHGASVTEVFVGFFGGISHGRHDLATARAAGRAAAAGPAASLLVTGISTGAALGLSALGAGSLPVTVFAALAWINGFLVVFNLLPGAGLDGGRIVRAVAWARSGDPARAGLAAARFGQVTGAVLAAAGLAAIALGHLTGIWIGLLGLIMVSASRAEARQTLTTAALSGLRVGDILPHLRPPVLTAQPWQTVQAFLDGDDPAGSGGLAGPAAGIATAFPLHDFDGGPAGLLTLTQLAAVPADHRDAVRLSQVATPLAYVVLTTPDEPLNDLIARMSVRPGVPAALHTAGHALVLDADGAVAGVLTPADFARATQLGALHLGQPAR